MHLDKIPSRKPKLNVSATSRVPLLAALPFAE